ncbi:hypothetical protein NsoK4_03385 [Nitrosopumilus sp. K4]|uniref:hypothetical protein n=1 Tax=Nitrosopumilus sp. K4 TaxID=2795383 RepID=UPI001BAA922D|nr:hypothetical protein [Nitrosopumilus sp. K4]QUC65302.1 hypothetical protein NsoK4_03385 [Nitrosopumilus sp. K4]
MSVAGLYMLNTDAYAEEKVKQALDMLLIDRGNEFRELASVLLPGSKSLSSMPHWQEFILNFCLDVEESFKTWSGKNSLVKSSPQKALTILRQLSRDKTSMNQLAHLLNISYNLSLEFKEIYRRLR